MLVCTPLLVQAAAEAQARRSQPGLSPAASAQVLRTSLLYCPRCTSDVAVSHLVEFLDTLPFDADSSMQRVQSAGSLKYLV